MLEFAYFEYAFFHIVVRALNLENSLDIISDPSIQVVILWSERPLDLDLGKGKVGTSEKQICLIAYKGS
jgi:hypothetical protein